MECETAATVLMAWTPFVACTGTVTATGVKVRQARPAVSYSIGDAIREYWWIEPKAENVSYVGELCTASKTSALHAQPQITHSRVLGVEIEERVVCTRRATAFIQS